MPSGRGVLYMKWGTSADEPLARSIASVKKFHPELPLHVATLPENASLLNKADMLDASPFEETLFLDVDTVVMDRLDFGFTNGLRFGLACCICECPWARRYGGLGGDVVEYNTGVLFFTRRAKPMFDCWKEWVGKLDSSIQFRAPGNELRTMPFNDQAGFSFAVERVGISPYVLPMNWNFRPEWQKVLCGPLKIWHDYRPIPAHLESWTDRQRGEQKVIEFTYTG
jgi:hypothetical protein